MSSTSEPLRGGGWWVFDAPFRQDPLVWTVILIGALAALIQLSAGESLPMPAISVGLQGSFVAAVLLGSIRSYWRARFDET